MPSYGQRKDTQTQVDEHITLGGTSAKKVLVMGRTSGNALVDALIDTDGNLQVDANITNTSIPVTEASASNIKTAVEAINTKMVSGTDIGNVTINNGAGANAVNIQDGGNNISVNGTVNANATLSAETTKVIGTVNIASAQTLATVTTITNDVGIKDNGNSITVDNNGTFAVQSANQSLPLATNVSSTLTLTSASTAYQITEPTSAFLVTYCNNSDTDMYWGFATLTSGGILLAKSGGVVSFSCAANNSPFFYCASAGKVLNYTTTVI